MLTTEWKIYNYVWKKLLISLISFFQKKKMSKYLCASLRYELVCVDMLFHKIEGNGGARGASHTVNLFNPLRPKSDLNELYHLSVREIMTIENMIYQVKFC